jgi:putative tricarboxylic transport membrane protein
MVEGQLVRTLQISGGEFSYLLTRPISAILLFGLVLSFSGSSLKRLLARANNQMRGKSSGRSLNDNNQ